MNNFLNVAALHGWIPSFVIFSSHKSSPSLANTYGSANSPLKQAHTIGSRGFKSAAEERATGSTGSTSISGQFPSISWSLTCVNYFEADWRHLTLSKLMHHSQKKKSPVPYNDDPQKPKLSKHKPEKYNSRFSKSRYLFPSLSPLFFRNLFPLCLPLLYQFSI